MRAMTIAIVAMSVGPAMAEGSQPIELPGWLAGCWVEEKGAAPDVTWTEECWTTARGGLMLGSGRSGDASRVRSWETMQIMRDGKGPSGEPVALAFWGAPRGANRTLFRWRADGGPGVSFYNEAHDYPQRIRYWRDGETLLAETALADGSKPQRWRYRRQ